LPVLSANQIGILASEAISSQEIIGEVIAVFPSSFYVRSRTDELLFFTNRALRSPITVNLTYKGDFTEIIKPPTILYHHHQGLGNSELSIDVTRGLPPMKMTPLIGYPDFEGLEQTVNVLATILSVIDTRGSTLDPDQLTLHDSVTDFVTEGILTLRNKEDYFEFKRAAFKIIGLGTGFTPSSDDFLLGFLVVYNSLAHTIGRMPLYLEFDRLTQRTNWISAKLVDYAQHSQVDEQMLHLIQSLSNRVGDTVMAFETLIPRGHTSGIDIAAGAIFALSLSCDIALGQTRTEKIASKLGLGYDESAGANLILKPLTETA